MSGHESPQSLPKEYFDELAGILGEGKMSLQEKRAYLEEHKEKLFQNVDFVSVATYKEIFKNLNLEGKTVINVGAGYAIAPGLSLVSPVVEALGELDPRMTLIPVDYDHSRNESWHLLSTSDENQNNNIDLKPVTADATELPFADNSIDGYVSNNLINEPRKEETEVAFVTRMFAEAYRVLKPGGFMVISSFGYFWWKLNTGSIIYNDNIDLDEIVEKEKIVEILGKVGFSQINEIALDEDLINKTCSERLERRAKSKGDTKEAGLRDACAFLVTK